MADTYLLEAICLLNYWNICVQNGLLLNNCIPLALKHVGMNEFSLSNGMFGHSNLRWRFFFCPRFAHRFGSMQPPTPISPHVIPPSGHAVVHPGQFLQMRQTESPPHCSSLPFPDSRIHTGRIEHKSDASILN